MTKISYDRPVGGLQQCYCVILTYETTTGSRRHGKEFYYTLSQKMQTKVWKYADKHIQTLGYLNPEIVRIEQH